MSVKHDRDHCLPLEAPYPVVVACECVPVTLDSGPLALASSDLSPLPVTCVMCTAARLPFSPQHLSGSPGSRTRARPCGPMRTVPESQHGLCVAHGLAGWDTGHLQDAASGHSSPPLCRKIVQRAGYSWRPPKVSLAHRIVTNVRTGSGGPDVTCASCVRHLCTREWGARQVLHLEDPRPWPGGERNEL